MDFPKLLSAERPPLPPVRKKEPTTSLPGTSPRSSRLHTRTVEGMKPGFSSLAPFLLSRKAGLSPSFTALSPYAAVMPPQRNETSSRPAPADIAAAHMLMQMRSSEGPFPSRPAVSPSAAGTAPQRNLASHQADPSEIAAAHTLLQLQSSVRSHRVGTIKAENLGEDVVPQVRDIHFAPTPATTISRTSAASQQLVATKIGAIRAALKGDKGSHPVTTSAVSCGFAVPHLSVVSQQVRERCPAASCGRRANRCGRKRRLDGPLSEHLAKRTCTGVANFATKETDPREGSEKGDKRPRPAVSAVFCASTAYDIGVVPQQVREQSPAGIIAGSNGCVRKRRLDAPQSEHLAKRACRRVISFATRETDPRIGRERGYAQLERKRRRCHDTSDELLRKRSRVAAPVIGKRVDAVAVC